MAVLEVVTNPAPVLRRKARKVAEFGPDLQKLVDDMVETMRAAPGVGLAAPQVDVSLRVIVVEFGDEQDEEAPPKLYALVNPEIVRASVETVTGTEGCLSIPGFVGEVERQVTVTVKGQNRRGQTIRIKAQGWLARIFQHEIDHLDGVLFIDKAEKIWKVEEEPAQVMPAD
ncbi:MAG TPA: peptide deformylase [Anaerolineales bacterium]|nr:peptide deformylase [Anaerolineales bacterium]